MKMMKKNIMLKIINNSLIDLPAPSNISLWWNFGSMLSMCLVLQTATGVFLAMNYCPDTYMAFESIIQISRNVNNGWLIRSTHANGASLMFLCMYIHLGRGIYYGSFMMKETWTMGTIILMTSMTTAFMGYVLPWGQMSFWGATVITNTVSAIPYIGTTLMTWIWGGFAVSKATLTRFFTLHFILPFMMMALSIMHLMFIHQTGSNNPLGTNSNISKIPFHPYFSLKDMLSMNLMMVFMMMVMIKPFMMMDPENFTPANPLVTPTHIQPEWYFLFAYTMLRSIPNKLGGVITLMMSITVLMIMPMMKKKMKSNQFYPTSKMLFWMMISTNIMLTWLGTKPVEEPFIETGWMLTTLYFLFFPTYQMSFKLWEKILMK